MAAAELFGNISANGFTATMDNPMCDLFSEQLDLYPDARVVLTHHPKGAAGWARSFTALMEMVEVQSTGFSWNYPNFLTFLPLLQDINAVRCIMGTKTMGLPASHWI